MKENNFRMTVDFVNVKSVTDICALYYYVYLHVYNVG